MEKRKYDVFLSHCESDDKIASIIASKLKADGLNVWYKGTELDIEHDLDSNIEFSIDNSDILVLLVSENALSSNWTELEANTFKFIDPSDINRRLIQIRLDSVEINGTLNEYPYIIWTDETAETAYLKLKNACWSETFNIEEINSTSTRLLENTILLEIPPNWESTHGDFLINKNFYISRFSNGNTIAWNLNTWERIDYNIDMYSNSFILELHRNAAKIAKDINLVIGLQNRTYYALVARENTMYLENIATGYKHASLEGHTASIKCIICGNDMKYAYSGAEDNTIKIWDIERVSCVNTLVGHTSTVSCLVLNHNGQHIVSGSNDNTIRVWNTTTGKCICILEGHTGSIISLSLSDNGKYLLSASEDNMVSLRNLETGHTIVTLTPPKGSKVKTISWSLSQHDVYASCEDGIVYTWNLSSYVNGDTDNRPYKIEEVIYTNAKALLVGDSGAGKTGLTRVLSGKEWSPSDSTLGAWASHIKLPLTTSRGMTREVWLWDFGGQADQRLIHQLYMDDTSAVILVFDGQKDSLFKTLGQWDRDIMRATDGGFLKLMVAGRVDAGGVRATDSDIDTFTKKFGYKKMIKTSAKEGTGCEKLRDELFNGIKWDEIPWHASPTTFKRLKDEIIRLKEEGKVLMRYNELRETLKLRLSLSNFYFNDKELDSVIKLLSGPGILLKLEFGGWILLQPELINSYAQVVIQTIHQDGNEYGCILEERVLSNNLYYHSSMKRASIEDERFILLAMHQILVEKGFCLREHTETGTLLIFPSYYRESPYQRIVHPRVEISYVFDGPLDEVYSTLIVRLHYTNYFSQEKLWKYAADFKTITGKKLGFVLNELEDGNVRMNIFFDKEITIEEKIIFSKYIQEHLQKKAKSFTRTRHYFCSVCNNPVGNESVIKKIISIKDKVKDIPCIYCDRPNVRIVLNDEMEKLFVNTDIKDKVVELQKLADIELDNESKDRALVGEVISTVALSGQICREFSISDHGIDMEIEFKDDEYKATGIKVYLQLKSGDSYIRTRKSDQKDIFTIKKERHAKYWANQQFPVFLVIRGSDGKVTWMEIRNYLLDRLRYDSNSINQIEYLGTEFNVMAIRDVRQKILSNKM